MYQVELIWNREFHFVNYGSTHKTKEDAIAFAKTIRDSGDGARVKKVRIFSEETNEIVWNG